MMTRNYDLIGGGGYQELIVIMHFQIYGKDDIDSKLGNFVICVEGPVKKQPMSNSVW